MQYVGRFAPSPTGPLHLGSLTTALASYLDARANGGQWLVRIEDIDPPREQPGAASTILRQLQSHALEWDHAVQYQSQRLERYRDALADLDRLQLTYPCSCNRARLSALPESYDRHCVSHPPRSGEPCAIRVRNEHDVIWEDLLQGEQRYSPSRMGGDFIVQRKDGLISYQLAVAVDDGDPAITRVIRGADLLESTPRQLLLIDLLGLARPEYGHAPVIVDRDGKKLSKQHGAPAVEDVRACHNLRTALRLLNQPDPDPAIDEPAELLVSATGAWDPVCLRGVYRATAPTAG